jgi:hypothetical protein
VGQAEHLAFRKRQPNAFCGQKPTPTFDRKSDKKLDGGNERFSPGFDGFAVDENGAG